MIPAARFLRLLHSMKAPRAKNNMHTATPTDTPTAIATVLLPLDDGELLVALLVAVVLVVGVALTADSRDSLLADAVEVVEEDAEVALAMML